MLLIRRPFIGFVIAGCLTSTQVSAAPHVSGMAIAGGMVLGAATYGVGIQVARDNQGAILSGAGMVGMLAGALGESVVSDPTYSQYLVASCGVGAFLLGQGVLLLVQEQEKREKLLNKFLSGLSVQKDCTNAATEKQATLLSKLSASKNQINEQRRFNAQISKENSDLRSQLENLRLDRKNHNKKVNHLNVKRAAQVVSLKKKIKVQSKMISDLEQTLFNSASDTRKNEQIIQSLKKQSQKHRWKLKKVKKTLSWYEKKYSSQQKPENYCLKKPLIKKKKSVLGMVALLNFMTKYRMKKTKHIQILLSDSNLMAQFISVLLTDTALGSRVIQKLLAHDALKNYIVSALWIDQRGKMQPVLYSPIGQTVRKQESALLVAQELKELVVAFPPKYSACINQLINIPEHKDDMSWDCFKLYSKDARVAFNYCQYIEQRNNLTRSRDNFLALLHKYLIAAVNTNDQSCLGQLITQAAQCSLYVQEDFTESIEAVVNALGHFKEIIISPSGTIADVLVLINFCKALSIGDIVQFINELIPSLNNIRFYRSSKFRFDVFEPADRLVVESIFNKQCALNQAVDNDSKTIAAVYQKYHNAGAQESELINDKCSPHNLIDELQTYNRFAGLMQTQGITVVEEMLKQELTSGQVLLVCGHRYSLCDQSWRLQFVPFLRAIRRSNHVSHSAYFFASLLLTIIEKKLNINLYDDYSSKHMCCIDPNDFEVHKSIYNAYEYWTGIPWITYIVKQASSKKRWCQLLYYLLHEPSDYCTMKQSYIFNNLSEMLPQYILEVCYAEKERADKLVPLLLILLYSGLIPSNIFKDNINVEKYLRQMFPAFISEDAIINTLGPNRLYCKQVCDYSDGNWFYVFFKIKSCGATQSSPATCNAYGSLCDKTDVGVYVKNLLRSCLRRNYLRIAENLINGRLAQEPYCLPIVNVAWDHSLLQEYELRKVFKSSQKDVDLPYIDIMCDYL